MVTHDAAVVSKVNKVKMKKMKKKKSKKKKIKGTENIDSESEADKLDLDQKIYPLSHYITDQEELVNQMFLTIRGSKLEAMLPPVLKSIPLKELKRLCLHELRGMSKKRILCCINGQVMEGSSGSEDEEEEKEEISEDPKHNETNATGEKRKPGNEQPPESYLQKKIKVEPGLEDGTGSGEGKSVLELLELEMRARIIKTMLEKGDEGKKITEDAIAAVMQSAKQITKENADASGGKKDIASTAAESKDDSQKKESEREAGGEDEAVDERRRGRRRGQGQGTDRRGRHYSARDGKRDSSTRSQKRGDGNYHDNGSHGRSSKRKESNTSEKHVMKKKKITRKEFEERMKRAKKNRTYRQRNSSEDEEKAKENENKTDDANEDKVEKAEDKTDKKQDTPPKGNSTQDKTEGEASEKEDGEIDSNEEEEGACSPSDVSSASRYSSSRSSSRSWSRSYSRSLSRSPYHGRQKGSRRRSRSRRRRRKSYSRSYSRSRTPDRKRGRGDHQQKERKRSQDSPKGNSKRDTKKTSPEDISPSREEDWGHKCDIEFVDSEEDFDDNPEATKKDSGAQKTLPVNRTERASISFSLQKKPVGIAQNVDLDDLPPKKRQITMIDDVDALDAVKPTIRNEEIVISSDSEVELQASPRKSLTEVKADDKKQAEQLATNSSNFKLVATRKTDQPSSEEDMSLQSDQEKKPIKVSDFETKSEKNTAGIIEESTEVLPKLTIGFNQEQCTEQKSIDGTKIALNVSNENTRSRREKQAVKNIDKVDSSVSITKDEFPTKDSKVESVNMDISGSTKLECDDPPERLNKDTEEHEIPYENKQVQKTGETFITDLAENVNTESPETYKEKGRDTSSKEKIQNVDTAEVHTSRVIDVGRRDELHMDIEQSSDKETKKITEREVNVKDKSLEEEEDQRDPETSISNQTTENKHSKEKRLKMTASDPSLCFETEEKMDKSDNLTTSEQKYAELDSKEAGFAPEDQSEEDFYRDTEQLKVSEDEKDSDINMKKILKDKTPIEPMRIGTGLIHRHVKPSKKIEMVMPERSWIKRDRKKRGKVKDVMGMERVGLLKSVQSEGFQSSSQDSELETETSQSTKILESVQKEEMPVHSPALVSDTEVSQPDDDLRGQKQACSSPKQDPPEISQTEDKTQRKIDHDTEIIGVIETSKEASDNFDDMEFGGSSWSMRWLQSEKVQKVVTSSKMLSRVRKKIQRKEKATKVVMAEKVEEAQKQAEPVIPVIGSIEEYERLFGMKVKKDETPSAAGGSGSQDSVGEGQTSISSLQTQDIPESKVKGNPVFGSDDDGEDSEEEALWSKIIKK